MDLKKIFCSLAALTTTVMVTNVLLTSPALAQEATPGYNTKIPESIMTPNDLKTRVGTFKYFDGIPTQETAAAIYNHLDYIRGVESFLNGMPAASYTEEKGQIEMNKQEITITIQLGRGEIETKVWTNDLSYEYIKINAEYRS